MRKGICLVLFFMVFNFVFTKDRGFYYVDIRTRTNSQQLSLQHKLIASTLLYVNASFHESIAGLLYLHVNLKKLNNKTGKFLLHQRRKMYDFCTFMEEFPANKILHPIYDGIFQETFLASCPLRIGFYNLEKFAVKAKYFPPDLLSGIYRLSLELTQILSETSKVFSLRFDISYNKEYFIENPDDEYGYDENADDVGNENNENKEENKEEALGSSDENNERGNLPTEGEITENKDSVTEEPKDEIPTENISRESIENSNEEEGTKAESQEAEAK